MGISRDHGRRLVTKAWSVLLVRISWRIAWTITIMGISPFHKFLSIIFLNFLIFKHSAWGQFDAMVNFRLLEANADNQKTETIESYRTEFVLSDFLCVMFCEQDWQCAGVWVKPIEDWNVECNFVNSTVNETDPRMFDFWHRVNIQNTVLSFEDCVFWSELNILRLILNITTVLFQLMYRYV